MAIIPNRSSPPAILLREAWREGKRMRRRTVATLSKLPPVLEGAIRAGLRGGVVLNDPGRPFHSTVPCPTATGPPAQARCAHSA